MVNRALATAALASALAVFVAFPAPAAESGTTGRIVPAVCADIRAAARDLGLSPDPFWSSALSAGRPRPVKLAGAVEALEVPLIAADFSSRTMYVSPDMKRVLVPPAPDASGSRTFLSQREWDEVSSSPLAVPGAGFSAYPGDFCSAGFPYSYRERYGGLFELVGPAIGRAAASKFRMIRFLESVPSSSVPCVKLPGAGRGAFFPAKTFSYAAAFCAGWWMAASSSTSEVVFGSYLDHFSGRRAFGVNPRVLDALYAARAGENGDFFGFSRVMNDPVARAERVHSSLEAYASLLVLPDMTSVPDPGGGGRYAIDESRRFWMDEEYISLFECFDGTDEVLVSALSAHGIILAGVPYFSNGIPVAHSAKAVVVVGHARAGGSTVFAYRDFEDAPGVLRAAPASFFREAYCFAHGFRAKARYVVKTRKLYLETYDSAGGRLDVDSISATFPTEDRKVKFLREAPGVYFHQVKKEDFSGVERAVLECELRREYYTKGDDDRVTLRYAIY